MIDLEHTHVIAVVNQKGGSGKSTSTVNLSGALAEMGYRVCMIDLDPQCNLSSTFTDEEICSGQGIQGEVPFTMADVLLGNRLIADTVSTLHNHYDGRLSLVPSHSGLRSVQNRLDNEIAAFLADHRQHSELDADEIRQQHRFLLRDSVKTLRGQYDFVFIDTPPDLGFLMTLALVATSHIIIPVFPSEYDTQGMTTLVETAKKVHQKYNSSLRLLGVLLGHYNGRSNHNRGMRTELSDHFGEDMMFAPIGVSVACAEAVSHKLTMCEYKPKHSISNTFRLVARQTVERCRNFEGRPINTSTQKTA